MAGPTYNSTTRGARAAARRDAVRRSFANDRPRDGQPATTSAAPGSVRHSLTVLVPVAVVAEVLLALAGGLPLLGLGTVVIAATALLTARYVAGAASQDSSYRRQARLMPTRAPGLGEWYWTVRNGLDTDAYPTSLRPQLQRLYAARLSERHGVSLYAEPARAAALLGPEVWPWLDPEHAAPSASVTQQQLDTLIHRLETL
jgi:hypothetical protein